MKKCIVVSNQIIYLLQVLFVSLDGSALHFVFPNKDAATSDEKEISNALKVLEKSSDFVKVGGLYLNTNCIQSVCPKGSDCCEIRMANKVVTAGREDCAALLDGYEDQLAFPEPEQEGDGRETERVVTSKSKHESEEAAWQYLADSKNLPLDAEKTADHSEKQYRWDVVIEAEEDEKE